MPRAATRPRRAPHAHLLRALRTAHRAPQAPRTAGTAPHIAASTLRRAPPRASVYCGGVYSASTRSMSVLSCEARMGESEASPRTRLKTAPEKGSPIS